MNAAAGSGSTRKWTKPRPRVDIAQVVRLCYTLRGLRDPRDPFQHPTLKGLTPGEFMQQRRLRLGDIVDDYCPRERRITNHAIVAMIDEEVKQTRCTTCDADHEYKHARIPPQRKKKDSASALDVEIDEGLSHGRMVTPDEPEIGDTLPDAPAAESTEPGELRTAPIEPPEDEGPVHRPLIRATLPRPEGHVPERKEPEFTIRQPGRGSRFDRGGNGRRPDRDDRRSARGPQSPTGGQDRFGGPRQGGQRQNGNRAGAPGPHRQGRHRGQGHGRKRGR